MVFPLYIVDEDVVFFGLTVVLIFLMLLVSFFVGWWLSRNRVSPCPYTGRALRRGSDLHYTIVEKVLRYLFDIYQYDNRLFDLSRAAICRDTGRIFPESVTWYRTVHVDWTFLQKRYPGKYVSYGSLTEEQKLVIQSQHESLEGFQVEFSSPTSTPRLVEPEYVYRKPGPLYVDVDTGILLGWKCVPDTDLEVLIVQKPKKSFLRGI